MNVQELFKSINEDEFLDLYLRNDRESIDMLFNTKYTPEEKFKKLQYYRQIVLDAFRECKNMQIKESSDEENYDDPVRKVRINPTSFVNATDEDYVECLLADKPTQIQKKYIKMIVS